MTESYLQYVWANSRVPTHLLKLVDGRSILIHKVGIHNAQLGGPDFFMGSVTIDSIRLYGSVEIHVKASDWYKHNHDSDENYNNVILHVVYENDIDVVLNNEKIPTIELKNYIDQLHFNQYMNDRMQKYDFPCKHNLSLIDPVYFESMKTKALYQKLGTKSTTIDAADLNDNASVLYHLLGTAFGTSVNKYAFERLVERVPYSSLRKAPIQHRYNLLMSESGIIQSETSTGQRIWHYKGTRPRNFPSIRVKQFALLSVRFNFDTNFQYLNSRDIIETFDTLLNKLWVGQIDKLRLSKQFRNHLMINAIVPYLWYLGEKQNKECLQDKALKVLVQLPRENNTIIKSWMKIGQNPNNAYDSQALLALNRYFCCRKKCLSCEVGNKILNR